jgi:hypothetical protein
MHATARPYRQVGWGDRAAIGLLGTAGCVLSYDALRQMAFAIHIRPVLTWLFPVVIDGFIAYGVRALLVLRGAPFRARLYAWALFATATVASIWANALHAIRLNQLATSTTELHLGDTVVGALSTIAPLALAGATHLYILITRHSSSGMGDPNAVSGAATPDNHVGAVRVRDSAALPSETVVTVSDDVPAQGSPVPVDRLEPGAAHDAENLTTAVGAPGKSDTDRIPELADDSADQPERDLRQGGRPRLASLERLVEVIRQAHPDVSTLTRDSARKALAEAGLGAATNRLTEAVALVRDQAQTREHPEQP